jgi:formylglycine-generating enzyme required for sulfatase activity
MRGPDPAGVEAERTWNLIQNTTSLEALDDFIRRYGDVPVYGRAARAKREALAKPVAPPSGVEPLTVQQERGLKPEDSFKECTDCPEMVVVPAGVFTMGSPANEKDRDDDEGPQHAVTIGKPFAAGKFHVTVDQFAAFVRETRYAVRTTCSIWPRDGDGSWRDPGFAQEGSHPVVCISWDDATAYVDWMARKTGKPYRLLSEAEFEYAARGRTSPGAYPRFWFGNDEKDLCRNGNGADQKARNEKELTWGVSCNDGYAHTSPAGHYRPNDFGLYDMAGNAWQWTADCWHNRYTGNHVSAPADGSAWTTACTNGNRVARGGSYFSSTKQLRAAVRGKLSGAYTDFGFRLARTLAP